MGCPVRFCLFGWSLSFTMVPNFPPKWARSVTVVRMSRYRFVCWLCCLPQPASLLPGVGVVESTRWTPGCCSYRYWSLPTHQQQLLDKTLAPWLLPPCLNTLLATGGILEMTGLALGGDSVEQSYPLCQYVRIQLFSLGIKIKVVQNVINKDVWMSRCKKVRKPLWTAKEPVLVLFIYQ